MNFSTLQLCEDAAGGVLELVPDRDGSIGGRLRNPGDAPLEPDRFGCRLALAAGKGRVLTGPGTMGGKIVRYDLEYLPGEIAATDFLLVRPAKRCYRLAGFLERRHFPGRLLLNGAGILTVEFSGDGRQLLPGEAVELDEVVILEHDNWQTLLELYAERIAARSGRPRRPAGWRGWGSWDYYCTTIHADAIRENNREIRRYVPEHPLIQLDDGYCIWGDWLEADPERFPDGVAAFSDEVLRSGGVPGLWVAPFLAHRDSRLLREHADWFLRDPGGNPLQMASGVPLYLLDYSQPAVCDWWRAVLTEMRQRWQIAYFKLDFLARGMTPGLSARPITAPERFQRCFDIIHEVIGDAYLLGCSADFPGCYNQVDGMRSGSDISPHRQWMHNSCGSCLAGAFLQGKVWNCDSDYIVLRTPEDEEGDVAAAAGKKSTFTVTESQTWANFVRLFGDSLIAGDKLSALQPERRALLAKIFADGGCRRCVPLDLWNGNQRSLPAIVLGDAGPAGSRLGFFNFTDAPRTLRLTGVANRWRDLDSGRIHQPEQQILAVTLEPGASLLLAAPEGYEHLRHTLRPEPDEPPIQFPKNLGEPFHWSGRACPVPLGAAARFHLRNRGLREYCVQQGRFQALAGERELLGVPVAFGERVVALQPDSSPVEIPVGLECTVLYLLSGAEKPVRGPLLNLDLLSPGGGKRVYELVVGRETGNTTLCYSLPWRSDCGRIAWHEPVTDAALYWWELRLEQPAMVSALRLHPLKQPGVFYLAAITAITSPGKKRQEAAGNSFFSQEK